MKYLITGIAGFVGRHYINYLRSHKPSVKIFGIDEHQQALQNLPKSIPTFSFSLLDRYKTEDVIKTIQPDVIIHLASQSSVQKSWEMPAETFLNNTSSFLTILESVKKHKFKTKILSVGTSEGYGVVLSTSLPLQEHHLTNPCNPYAIARVAQEQLSSLYSKAFNIPIICTRSFNHVGPYQSPTYVVSSLVKQCEEINLGLRTSIDCGNTAIVRDFIDVRDVIKAYELLIEHGIPGEIYNICSGTGRSIEEVITHLEKLYQRTFQRNQLASLMRPIDNPIIIGSNKKLVSQTNFTLHYTFEQSLQDMIVDWRKTLSKTPILLGSPPARGL